MYRMLCIHALALTVACSPSDDPEPRGGLNGEWEAVALVSEGVKLTENETKAEKFSCSIAGKKFIYRHGDNVREMTISVNRKASPAEIDFVMPRGKGTLEAIFSVDRDRLVICMNSSHWLPDRADEEPGRPRSFTPDDPANRGLKAVHTFTFQRKRK